MDPWKILGIREDADIFTIKRAYRTLLWKCHPDLHPESKGALRRFLEITEAYNKLKDLLRIKARIIGAKDLDQEIQDLFLKGAKGRDYSFFYLEVPYEDAFWGRSVSVVLLGRESTCPECAGIGYVWEGEKPRCPSCMGRGYKEIPWGNETIRLICKSCGATGFSHQAKCQSCNGKGHIRIQREIYFSLPKGLKPGTLVEINPDPELGINRTFLEVGIKLPKGWRFDGLDVVSSVEVSVWDALTGAKIQVDTIEGIEEVEIPPGTTHGTQLVLKGKGWIDDDKRGDHRIIVEVIMPKGPISEEVRDIIQRLKGLWPVPPLSRN